MPQPFDFPQAFRTTKLGDMPFVWIQTVVSPRADRSKGATATQHNKTGPESDRHWAGLAIRGLYIGDGTLPFDEACKLSVQVWGHPLLRTLGSVFG